MDYNISINDDFSDIDTADLLDCMPSFFTSFGDVAHTAFLNWRFDSFAGIEFKFFEMGNAYFDTALVLIESCIQNNEMHKADAWIFPILFHVIHGIELYLKGFISNYKRYLGLQKEELKDSTIEGNHDIRQLCQTAIKLMEQNGDKDIRNEFKFIERFIGMLYKRTTDMTFARYPISSKKGNHFYVNQQNNIPVNLNVLRQWVIRSYRILDDCSVYFQSIVEDMTDTLLEMGS